MDDGDFPARLLLALKALSISRGRLAAQLEVDKSVVSRWLNGRQAPSGQNLVNLTDLVAARRPGFTLLDWEADLDALATKLGVAPEPVAGWGLLEQWVPESVLREAHTLTGLRGDAYEGFWRTTRPAISQPGRFIHNPLMIRKASNGFLVCRSAVEDMRLPKTSYRYDHEPLGPFMAVSWFSVSKLYVVVPPASVAVTMLPSAS